jgi:hypothetical protein
LSGAQNDGSRWGMCPSGNSPAATIGLLFPLEKWRRRTSATPEQCPAATTSNPVRHRNSSRRVRWRQFTTCNSASRTILVTNSPLDQKQDFSLPPPRIPVATIFRPSRGSPGNAAIRKRPCIRELAQNDVKINASIVYCKPDRSPDAAYLAAMASHHRWA